MREQLFGAAQILRAIIQGAVVFTAVLTLYVLALPVVGLAQSRALVLTMLIAANLTLALATTSGGHRLFSVTRPAFWAIAGLAGGGLLLAIYAPPIAAIFHVEPPAPALEGAAAAAGVVAGGAVAVGNALTRLFRGSTAAADLR
jgi:hypothetical protein